MLYAHLPFDERAIRVAQFLGAITGGARDEMVLLAHDGDTPVGALVAKLRPGHSAFVWPPVMVASGVAMQVADELLTEACRLLDAAGVAFGQALLEQDDIGGRATFVRNGFVSLTNLTLLARSFDEPLPTRSNLLWGCDSYTPAARSQFASLLERTCVGSLDCAGLRGALCGDDTLALHQASGEFDPQFWLRFTVRTHDAGLVLVNPHPVLDSCEVSYIGVVPEFRGAGLGREMLIEAMKLAKTAGFVEVFLAVDEKNHFARTTYQGLGFRIRESRAVHVRAHPEHAPHGQSTRCSQLAADGKSHAS